jgi:hypothetical protein
MKFQTPRIAGIGGAFFAVVFIQAKAMSPEPAATADTNITMAADTGIFGGLDHRSAYFQDFFPQPLLVDDTGLEEGELEFASLHTQASGQHSDIVSAGAQKSFGLLTFELAVPYERDVGDGAVAQGIGNISLGARYPLYQMVSSAGFF